MASNAVAPAGQLIPPAEESTPPPGEPGDHDGDRHRSASEATSVVANDAEADHNADADRETQVEDAKRTRKSMPPQRFALIVGDDDQGNVRCYDAPGAFNALLQRITFGAEIQNEDITVSSGEQVVDSILVGPDQNLELTPQVVRNKQLQFAVFRK